MKFNAHFKLELDIKTNSDNIKEVLELIADAIREKLNENIKDISEVEIIPTITNLNLK